MSRLRVPDRVVPSALFGSVVLVSTMGLAGCGRTTEPVSAAAGGQSAAATAVTANPGASVPGQAAGSRREGGAAGSTAKDSVSATVARLGQSLDETNAACFEGDVEALEKAAAAVRDSLRQLQWLLPRAKIDAERSLAANKAVADLSACCAQAESRMRSGKELEQAEMQAFAQRIEAAFRSLESSTAGLP